MGTGAKKIKDKGRSGMVDMALDVSAKVINYAKNVRDMELYGAVNYKRRDLVLFTEEDCLEVCKVIYERAKGVLSNLVGYGVDGEKLEELLKLIERFRVSMPAPRDVIEARAKATKGIEAAFVEAHLLLKRLDEMVLTMRVDAPEFYSGFRIARRLRKPGFRKLAGQGRVVDAEGNALGFVVMSCGELGMRKKLSEHGGFRLKGIKEGKYWFLFEKEGFLRVGVEVCINKGKRVEVLVVMERGEN